MRRHALASLTAVLLLAPAYASSDDAMMDYDREVTGACFAASAFKDPIAHTKVIMFDDSVGIDALIVEGEYPQEHMKGQRGEMLCLFNKTARSAVVSEIQHAE